MFGFRMTRREYKAATQRQGLSRVRKKIKRQKKAVPTWQAPVNGKRMRFKAFTKSEVRAMIKELTGEKLPKSFGHAIIIVG